MADIAKRAGKEDARSHRGRGADITKRAGNADDGNGRRRHRRDHKDSARPPTSAPAEVASTASIILAAAEPDPATKPAPVVPAAAKPAPVAPAAPAAPTTATKPAPAAKSTSIAPTAVTKPTPATPTEAKPAPAEKSTAVKVDPATLDLSPLFNNPAMFESRTTWQAAGFTIIAGKTDGEIIVATHPSAPGILFKKFTSTKSVDDQLRNYQTRIEGARKLRAFIVTNRLERVVVPRKWLQQLPGPAHILVEDHVDVLTRSATQEAYNDLDERTLHDLCVVVRAFPGLDSGARNMLLTKDGKIAFIDTERWDEKRDRDRDRPGLRHIRDYLSDKQRKSVQKIFQQLDEA